MSTRAKVGLILLMSSGIVINYIDRVNISHAILPMSRELKLSAIEQGVVLSAFSWGYVLFMLLGGVLVDRAGPVRVAGLAATFWSLGTAWTGLAGSFTSILASRLSVGVAEAPIFPANARLVRDCYPLQERGRATAVFDAGSYVGTAICAPLVVPIIVYLNWRISFVICSLLGLLWVGFWTHSATSLRRRLTSTKPLAAAEEAKPTGAVVGGLLRNRKVLGASFGFFAYNYGKSFYLTWFPAYLVNEEGFTFLSVGLAGIVPPLCAIAGELCAGWWTDRAIIRGMSVTFARKLPICLGLILSSSIALSTVVNSKGLILGVLSFAFAANISASPGIWAIPGDIAPRSALVGTIGGIQNTFSNIAGIVAPVVTGYLFGITGSFGLPLLLSGIVSVLGALSYWLVVGILDPLKIRDIKRKTEE